jgi:hypothetical protein
MCLSKGENTMVNVANALKLLGNLMCDLKEIEQAKVYYKQAMDIYGEEHDYLSQKKMHQLLSSFNT